MSDSGSVPTRSAGTSWRSASVQMMRLRASGDVVIRHHVAIGGNDGAAARGLEVHFAAVLRFDDDDRNANQAWIDGGNRPIDRRAVGRLGRGGRGERAQDERDQQQVFHAEL